MTTQYSQDRREIGWITGPYPSTTGVNAVEAVYAYPAVNISVPPVPPNIATTTPPLPYDLHQTPGVPTTTSQHVSNEVQSTPSIVCRTNYCYAGPGKLNAGINDSY
ncbi:hypothetical protein DdX_17819 [Ditylenchus destructor]|uniref:Uncharacterized protein n=1 Tax=Ditylenchus destructor TaxID=166010 RepID=A0AAD4MMC6_9BILA|nr:hypothetical protein DdX_17819 [Ditylenchus destructor]